MTTSSINHRPGTVVAVATTGFVGTLLAATLTSAHAIPEHDDGTPAAGRTVHPKGHVHTHGHYVERACFIKPLTWNTAEGPLPRCHTYVP